MPILSDVARARKRRYFMRDVAKDAQILEVGASDGALATALRSDGYDNYVTLDLAPPADVVGDIRDWRALGLLPASFDVIIAFELVEHVHCFQELWDLLKPGGRLMLTSPVPRWDGAMQILERLGLNQRRTSPHDHLIDFETIPLFEPVRLRRVAFIAQWGILQKSERARMVPKPAPQSEARA